MVVGGEPMASFSAGMTWSLKAKNRTWSGLPRACQTSRKTGISRARTRQPWASTSRIGRPNPSSNEGIDDHGRVVEQPGEGRLGQGTAGVALATPPAFGDLADHVDTDLFLEARQRGED